MADNTERIAAIRTILETGVSSVNIGGEEITYNFDTLRQELRRLEREDSTAKTKRPMVLGIKLDRM